jgi:alkylhydroperoxidase family enzyme
VSSQAQGTEVDLRAVHGEGNADTGVAHGARLLAFTEAVLSDDDAAIARERTALRDVLSPGAFVDACAVIGAFNVVDRIADATGIPLDGMLEAMSAEVRAELDLGRFASSANTPGASGT